MEITYIGRISRGIDGYDDYFHADFGRGTIDEGTIEDWFISHHYDEGSGPGEQYCTNHTVQKSIYDCFTCTVIVHKEYDV